MITNTFLIGVLGAFAIIGAAFLLEVVVWLSIKSCLKRSQQTAFRLSHGAQAGFSLQLASSSWFSWSRLPKLARKRCKPKFANRKQLTGMAIITSMSAVCIFALIMLEVAVVYASQSTVVYKTVQAVGVKVFKIGQGGRLSRKFVQNGFLELDESVFSESLTKSYRVQAGLGFSLMDSRALHFLAEQGYRIGDSLSIWTEYLVDGKNSNGSDISDTYRDYANSYKMHVGEWKNELFACTCFRAVKTLTMRTTSLFTDFSEAEAHVIESKTFEHIGLDCSTKGTTMQGSKRIIKHECAAPEIFFSVDGDHVNYSRVFDVLRVAFTDIGRSIFQVTISDFSTEWMGADGQPSRNTRDRFEGVVEIVSGIDESSTNFILLATAALIGVARILTGAIVDYRKLCEKHMFKAFFNGSCLAGPGNWDISNECAWRVYRMGTENCSGYSQERWVGDEDNSDDEPCIELC